MEKCEPFPRISYLPGRLCNTAIYLSADEVGPQFRIGDYSWTVYLHNLSRYLSAPGRGRIRDRSYWRYRAPELQERQQIGESFSTDLYALGCTLAGMICPAVLTALINRNDSLEDVDFLDLIRTDEGLTDLEKRFFEGMMATEPSNRFENSVIASEFALYIARRYGREALHCVEIPLIVTFDIRPETNAGKRNLDGLAKWIDIEGIIPRIDTFLQQDLSDVDVYITDKYSEDIPRLYIRGKSGIPYSAIPYFDKKKEAHNLHVAHLNVIPFDPKNVSDVPIGVLACGVQITVRGWEEPRSSDSWAPLFIEASKKDEKSQENKDVDVFRDNLWYIHNAERALAARRILPVRVVDRKSNEDGKGIVLELAIRPGIGHPECQGLLPELFDKWVSMMFKQRDLFGYLTPDPAMDIFPEEYQKVGILGSTSDGRLKVEFLGDIPPTLGENLWLKPGGIKSTVIDFKRKRSALRTVNSDDYLLQVLTKPEQNTLFLDPTEKGELWEKILNTRPLYIVQGPPGTGKTYTATRVITGALRAGAYNRILVVAQAHKPLDHILKETRLALQGENFNPPPITVRLAQREGTDRGSILTSDEDLTLLTKQILQRSSRWTSDDEDLKEIETSWLGLIEDELTNPGPAWTDLILRSANVVFTTAMSRAIVTLHEHPPFDLIIVEEAAKAYPTELLGALRLGRNWLLIGDQLQLPPFQFEEMEAAAALQLKNDDAFINLESNEQALAALRLRKVIRFFDSLHKEMKNAPFPYMPSGASRPAIMLTTQRRLPPEISELISKVFYKQPFIMETPPREPILRLPIALSQDRLIWIDTPSISQSQEYREYRSRGGSYKNPGEASLIFRILMQGKFGQGHIAILSPYNAQVDYLRDMISQSKEAVPPISSDIVNTVDSFQGREADLVIVSMVRNNLAETPSSALGFLQSAERMNVILSRARCQLIVIGNLKMFAAFDDPEIAFLREIESYIRGNALILTPATVGLRP